MGSTAPVIPPGFSLESPPAPQPAVTPHVPEGFHVEGQAPAGPQIPDGFHLAPEPTMRADHPGLGDYVRRMVFGGPQGETSLGRAFPSMSGAVMSDVPTTQLPTVRAEEAIPSEAQLGNVQGTGAGATARNVGRGVAAGLSGLTTPENLGLLAATGGVGAVPAEAIGWGAAGGRAAQAAMSAYFAYQMAHGATDAVRQAYEMHQQGDDESAAKALGFAGTQGMMAALGLRHTVHETRALGKTKIPTTEFMRPGEEPPAATGPYNREPQPPGGPGTPGSSPGEPPTEQAVQPKAPPPSDVERIGPRTPNPPTASHPTAPESPQTISLQLEQLANGKRKVVMIPKGTVAPDQYPEGSSLTNDGMGNVYVFDPQQIKRAAIKSAARTNRLNEILGHADMGMGSPDKSELQGEPAAVVARAPDGTEVHSVATDETNAPTAIAAASQLTPEGGSVSLEPVESALKSREEQQPEPSPAGVPPTPAIPEGFHVEEAQPPAVQRAPVSPEVAEWAKQSNLWLKQQGIFGGTAGMNRVLDPEVVYHLARSVAGDVVRGSVSLKGAAARIATRLRQSNRQVLNAKGSQKVQAAVESALQDYTRLLPPPEGERVSPLRQSIIEPQALKRLERAARSIKSGKSYHLDVLQTNGRDIATDEGRLKVYNALREAGAPDDMVIGFQPIERDGQPGIRLIKWRGKWGDKKIAAFSEALAKSTPEGYEMAIKHGPLELTEASNQWEEQPNGQGYLGQLDDRGRQSERQWLERELRPAVAKLLGAEESGAGKPPERRDTGVYLGSGLGALQPYLDKFAKEDIIPALKATTRKATGAWDDIKRLLAPQTRGGQAKESAGSLREMMGTLAHKEAVAHASLEGFRKALYAEPKEYGVHGLNIIDAIEGRTPVNHLRPDLQQFASTVRDLYEERKDLLDKMGLVQNFIENYFTHMYKDPAAAQAWTANWSSKRPMQGRESFRKQRVYPTLRDALEDPNFTLEAKFDNPVDYVYAGLAQMDKSIEAHELFEDWKDKGYLKFSRHGPPSPGWAAIDDKIFTVHGPRRGAVKLPTGANISPEDVEVFGKREMGRYYAPDQIAQVANNYLSPTLRGKAGFDAWMALKGAFNAINLGFSAFHLLTTALNSATSDIALGVRQVSHGKLGKAAGNVAAGMSYVVPGIRDLIKGTRLEKVYNGTASNPTAMEVAIVDAIKSAGGSPMQNTHGADLIAGMKKAWAEGNPLGAAARAVNPLLWSQGFSDLIMKRVVPRVKLAAFAKAAEYEISRNPTMTPEEARAKFGQILDSMDNRFGQLNQNNMLMRGIVKDAMNAIVGRPGWTVGFFREVMGGASDVVGNISDLLKGKSTEISHRTAYTIALVLGGAALNGVATALLTQSQPKGTDYIAPRDGGVNEDGKPSRIVLPLYLSKDVLSWATRPVATFKAKLAQPLMVGMDLATNRDFQMHKIYGDGSLGISNYLVHLVFPYSLSGAMQNVERGQTKLKTVLPFVGIMPASSRVGQSKAEGIIQNWKDEQRSQTAPVPTEHSKARSQIYKAAQSKDLAKAQQLGKEAEAKGSMTPKDVNQAITRARTSPLVQDIKTVTDLGTVLKAFDAATPDERKTIQQEVRKKVVQARSKSYKWTPEMRELANRYFHIQPSAGGDFQAPKGIF